MQVPQHRLPLRDYQKEIVQAFNDPKIDELLLVIARRGAKTTTTFSEGIVPDLVRRVQTAVAVYPTAKMGFRNFWNNIEDDGFKTLDHMPKPLVARQSNSEDDMRMELINGSIFMTLGATNTEALRGANGKNYWFDEFADQPIEAVNVIAPITERNKGKRIYTGTPKIDGINGETMHRMHEAFKADKTGTKYTCYIDATHYMTPDELERTRQGYILRNGNDFKFRQEMLLDWGQASETSYYGQIISQLKTNGGIGIYPYNAAYPVYTAWDLGMSDALAIVFFQYFNGQIRIIDFLETSDFALNSVVPFLKTKPYNYGWHFLPHDSAVRSMNDNVSRLDYLYRNGIMNASTLRREGVSIGIDRVLERLPKVVINIGTTASLVRKLPIYRRKYNPETGDYIGADHKSESHAADAIRYMFTAIHYYFSKKGDFLIENDVQEASHLDIGERDLETTYYF
jgi:phage terminase large subunit